MTRGTTIRSADWITGSGAFEVAGFIVPAGLIAKGAKGLELAANAGSAVEVATVVADAARTAKTATTVTEAVATASRTAVPAQTAASTAKVAEIAESARTPASALTRGADRALAQTADDAGRVARMQAGARSGAATEAKGAATGSVMTESDAARGISQHGGVFSSEFNAAGGELYLSDGLISQKDFAAKVQSALYKGDVDIISGVHGQLNGSVIADVSLLEADVARFGSYPGVKVHNFPELSAGELKALLNSENTVIGGFCYSCNVLKPHL